MRRSNDWRWLWGITLLSTALLIIGLGAVACGSKTANAPTSPGTTPGNCDETRLAARDLAGNCRATPQATMGALEAVSS